MKTIEQAGKDCIVTIGGVMRRVKDCNALKLANTIWNKDGEQYTREEMEKMGFELK